MADERHGVQTSYSYDPLSRPNYDQNLSSSSRSNRFAIVEDTLSDLLISTNGPLPPPPDEATLSLISDALASTSIHHSISVSSWPDSDESRANLISLIEEDTRSITRTAKEKLKNEEGYSGHYDPTAHLLSIDEKDAYGKTFCPSCRKYFCSHGSCEWRGDLGVDDLRGSHFFYHWIEEHSRLMFPCTCHQSFANDGLFEKHVEQDLENHDGSEDATLMALIHCQDFFQVVFQNFDSRVHNGYTELLPPTLLKPVDPRSLSLETNSKPLSQTSTLDPLKVKAFNLLDQKVCQQFQQLLNRPQPPINRDPASTARLRAFLSKPVVFDNSNEDYEQTFANQGLHRCGHCVKNNIHQTIPESKSRERKKSSSSTQEDGDGDEKDGSGGDKRGGDEDEKEEQDGNGNGDEKDADADIV